MIHILKQIHLLNNDPTVYGVGFNDVPKGSTEYAEAYKRWKDMLRRGYAEEFKQKNPTYQSTTVDKRWHTFSVFLLWHNKNYRAGDELDKDILVKGNNRYGPDTCMYLPKSLNMLLQLGDQKPYKVSENAYTIHISVDGKKKHLGTYPNPEKAKSVYREAKKLMLEEAIAKTDRPAIKKAITNFIKTL